MVIKGVIQCHHGPIIVKPYALCTYSRLLVYQVISIVREPSLHIFHVMANPSVIIIFKLP